MMQISRYLRKAEGQRLTFWCPGCQETHMISYGPDGWTWNHNADKPTFTPSILVTGSKLTELGEKQWRDYCEHKTPIPNGKCDSAPMRCHSYVTDGHIQFLADCTHHLAGQTVPLPELPDWLRD